MGESAKTSTPTCPKEHSGENAHDGHRDSPSDAGSFAAEASFLSPQWAALLGTPKVGVRHLSLGIPVRGGFAEPTQGSQGTAQRPYAFARSGEQQAAPRGLGRPSPQRPHWPAQADDVSGPRRVGSTWRTWGELGAPGSAVVASEPPDGRMSPHLLSPYFNRIIKTNKNKNNQPKYNPN